VLVISTNCKIIIFVALKNDFLLFFNFRDPNIVDINKL